MTKLINLNDIVLLYPSKKNKNKAILVRLYYMGVVECKGYKLTKRGKEFFYLENSKGSFISTSFNQDEIWKTVFVRTSCKLEKI